MECSRDKTALFDLCVLSLQVRAQLIQQIEAVQLENTKLQAANSDLQRQRDNLEDEKEDVLRDKERQVKENERW